jgi:hypothetical protein
MNYHLLSIQPNFLFQLLCIFLVPNANILHPIRAYGVYNGIIWREENIDWACPHGVILILTFVEIFCDNADSFEDL